MRQPRFIRIPIGEKFRLFNSQGLQFSFETASLFYLKEVLQYCFCFFGDAGDGIHQQLLLLRRKVNNIGLGRTAG
jgi:hypothetical protein